MCGLSNLSKVLHKVVFPEPGSPVSNTGWFAAPIMFKRYVCFPYCVNTENMVLKHVYKLYITHTHIDGWMDIWIDCE